MFLSTCAFALPSLLFLLHRASAATTHDIDVGKGGLIYTPDTVTAAQGDTLRFHFYGPVHNVAQSTFDKPCQPVQGAIFSGDVMVDGSGESDTVFNVMVNNTDPIWIYCSEDMHCPSGMAMVVNQPADKKLDQYKTAAKSATPADPGAVSGGILAKANEGSGSSSPTSASSSSSASAAATSMMSVTGSTTTMAPSSSTSAAPASTGAADSLTRSANARWMVLMGLGGAMMI